MCRPFRVLSLEEYATEAGNWPSAFAEVPAGVGLIGVSGLILNKDSVFEPALTDKRNLEIVSNEPFLFEWTCALTLSSTTTEFCVNKESGPVGPPSAPTARSPTPPVEVRTGADSRPLEKIETETMEAPAALLPMR